MPDGQAQQVAPGMRGIPSPLVGRVREGQTARSTDTFNGHHARPGKPALRYPKLHDRRLAQPLPQRAMAGAAGVGFGTMSRKT